MLNVLIVEDDVSNLTVYKYVIEAMGHQVQAISDAEIVMDAVYAMQPDVLFLDLLLSHHITGLDLIIEIRSQNIPMRIIAITAATLQFPELDVLHAGADMYLAKPVGRQQIQDAFATVLTL